MSFLCLADRREGDVAIAAYKSQLLFTDQRAENWEDFRTFCSTNLLIVAKIS